MRRWLAVLLLVMLPLQATWAAVAGYCAHGPVAGAHPAGDAGNTAHGHTGEDAHIEGSEGSAWSALHADCSHGHCHGHGSAIVGDLAAAQAALPAAAPPSPGDARCAEHTPAQPERPQWARLA